jgi:hypothetical protein
VRAEERSDECPRRSTNRRRGNKVEETVQAENENISPSRMRAMTATIFISASFPSVLFALARMRREPLHSTKFPVGNGGR